MNRLCIIPARGGSKRIPRKNIREFAGKPIIAFSIEAALNCELFDEVMISTDDDEIAQIAESYGASVPFRRNRKAANDTATLLDVIEDVLLNYNNKGQQPKEICCLLATAPFVTIEMLRKAYKLFQIEKYDSVFPIVKFDNPIQRSLKFEGKKLQMNWPNNIHLRSQDLEDCYYDSGLFYWLNQQPLIKKKLWTDNSSAIVLNSLVTQDIDTESDWKLAELKYNYLKNEQRI